MKRYKFSMFCLIAALSSSVHTAGAQVINATMQNASARVVTSRGAPAARPIANTAIAPHVALRPARFTPRTFNSYAPRMAGQSVPNAGRNYSPYIVRSLNPTVGPISTQRSARIGDQRAITLDPAVRETELRTLAAMREQRRLAAQNQTLATTDPQQHGTSHDPTSAPQPETDESHARKTHGKKDNMGFDEASRRHWHEWHDRNWWHNHCDTIVFVSTGYYFLDGSYWYPAYGYDPFQSYYDYDGPIYTYSNLLPDEVIANVQTALQDAGYYSGPITGSLSVDTRAAIANFQRDYGLPITGAIDEPTVESLGLYQRDDVNSFQTGQSY